MKETTAIIIVGVLMVFDLFMVDKRYVNNNPDQFKSAREVDMPFEPTDSIVLISSGKTYTKSSAALRICLHLGGLYPILFIFMVMPKGLRDLVYDFIAKNRYRWFGKKDQCMIPDNNIKHKFL